MNDSGYTPGGMGVLNWQKFSQELVRNGWNPTGYKMTKYGQVYFAEKFNGKTWDVVWISRDMAQPIECLNGTSQKQRAQAALNAAFHHLFVRAESFGEA